MKNFRLFLAFVVFSAVTSVEASSSQSYFDWAKSFIPAMSATSEVVVVPADSLVTKVTKTADAYLQKADDFVINSFDKYVTKNVETYAMTPVKNAYNFVAAHPARTMLTLAAAYAVYCAIEAYNQEDTKNANSKN